MKVTFTFDLDEAGDKELYRQYTVTEELHLLLWDIEQEVFRPARKHGYPGPDMARLNELLEQDYVQEAIELLESLYYKKKEERLTYE